MHAFAVYRQFISLGLFISMRTWLVSLTLIIVVGATRRMLLIGYFNRPEQNRDFKRVWNLRGEGCTGIFISILVSVNRNNFYSSIDICS